MIHLCDNALFDSKREEIVKAIVGAILSHLGLLYMEQSKGGLKKALDVLVRSGLLKSPEYWLENARASKTVKGEYAGLLIERMAEFISHQSLTAIIRPPAEQLALRAFSFCWRLNPPLLPFSSSISVLKSAIYCPVDGEGYLPPIGGKTRHGKSHRWKPEINYEKKPVSPDQLQREHDYFAQQILESMLKNNLITADEFI